MLGSFVSCDNVIITDENFVKQIQLDFRTIYHNNGHPSYKCKSSDLAIDLMTRASGIYPLLFSSIVDKATQFNKIKAFYAF